MTTTSREELIDRGMAVAVHAGEAPERTAIVSRHGDRTFAELNGRANQLVRALRRRGLQPGDGVALVCSNRPEFAEVQCAVLRAGWRVTTVNWHLTAEEVGYIVDDSRARALVGDARFADVLAEAAGLAPAATARLAVGGPVDGFDPYDEVVGAEADGDIGDPSPGTAMLYTSGTTGRPKGVYRPPGRLPPTLAAGIRSSRYRGSEHRHLCTGPLYHAAPLSMSLNVPLHCGTGVVLMDGWDAEECLGLVEAHRITHTHMVPTMFHRLLALPEGVRTKYDLSSLRYVVHGAAPCPVAVKRAIIDWLGPVVHEYYAATEGGGTWITPREWLERPGSVGRPSGSEIIEVRDETGTSVPPGTVGTIFFKAPETDRFEYFGDREKTERTYRGDFFTLGDLGYLDDDGYLFLTGRSAELIISGGVNIYPAEVDAVLLGHPDVADVATVGVPNEEWGEEVKAVVLLRPAVVPSGRLAEELLAFCRARLAHYKCPRTIDFVADLPRFDTGKIYRRLVRDRYWPQSP